MHAIFLTPASISYLTQFILGLAITLFLLNRLRSQRTPSLFLITAFFAPMTVFSGLLVFNAALLPYPRLLTVYAENAVLGLALAALNGFAYHFPERYPQHKWEMRIVLALNLAYFFWEVGFMVFRYGALLGQGNVFIRPALIAYSIPILVLFAPLALLRQTLAADPRRVAWWRKLWKPEGKGAQGARNFALVLGILVVLGIVNALVFFGLSLTVIHAIISIGILITYWLFANNYVNFIPASVDVASRLSILVLTLFLALLGTLGWLIAPSYIATFQPTLRDQQTLRFTPNASGGYDVIEVDFHFDSALGEKYNQRVEFTFPFYGKTYTEIYVSQPGAIGLGQPPRLNHLQAPTARTPTIFPLLINLVSNPADQDSGLYVRREPGQLTVTWNRLLDSSQPETHYTFQTILFADGTFEFTYKDLPQRILFAPNSVPSDNPWLRGAVAGRGEPLHNPSASGALDLIALSQNGESPLLENFHSTFRRYLHTFMLPVAWVIISGSLFILFAVPLLLRSSIARPLEALTAGVRRMGAGEMDIRVPVQTADEIGFLTGAFNTMSGALDDHVRNLETRVADRTRELDNANASLRAEMLQREAAQDQLFQQQRALAAFEERERLARELHDGLGQTFGFVNLQTQAAHTLIQQGQGSEASALLSRLADVTQDAHRDLRGYIQNLKNVAPAAQQEFFAVLENYCLHLWQAYFFKVRLILPQDFPATLASPQVEMHLTYIIREALGNARRYSGQNEASVRIDVEENYLEVIIQDDGAGFETGYSGPERRKNAHYGLAIMRERAQEVGGSISIESAPGRGTRITARLPRNLPREGLPPENILIVDDHPLFVEGLKNMLVVHGAQVAGVARDGAQAIEMATALQPGLILMDIHMPRMGGLEATRRIKEVMPGVKIVMLTTSADEAEVYEALRVGASGYLLKGMNKDEFIVTLAGVSRGEVAFSTEVAKQILSEFSDQTTPGGPGEATQPGSLSERQMVILRMVAQGLQYKEIGDMLFITERTVKYHVGEILTRLQLKNKRDMQDYARRAGLA